MAQTLWDELLPMTSQLHGRVLDAGCGNGDYTRRMRDEVDSISKVVSVDIAPIGQEAHGKRFTDNVPGGHYVQGDIQDMKMFKEGEFDCVLCWHTLEHIDDQVKAMREFARVTKPGGLVMVSMPMWDSFIHEDYNAKYKGTLSEHKVVWNPGDLLKAAMEAGLEPAGETYIDQCSSQSRLFAVTKKPKETEGGKDETVPEDRVDIQKGRNNPQVRHRRV